MITSINPRLFIPIKQITASVPVFKGVESQGSDNFTSSIGKEHTAGGLSLKNLIKVLNNAGKNIDKEPELLIPYKY